MIPIVPSYKQIVRFHFLQLILLRDLSRVSLPICHAKFQTTLPIQLELPALGG